MAAEKLTREEFVAAARLQGDERNELDILLAYKSDEPRIFIIPSPNMSKFEERFAKLQKRATKIGCKVPTFTIVKESTRIIQVIVGEYEDAYGNVKRQVEDKILLLNHITIDSGEVVVEGHEFVCSIEHTEEGNILHTLKGKSVPLSYRECKPWCDHCKTLRRRNDTFVVRHIESDTYKQVGRNCLADFFGRDASQYAAMAELYYEVDELAEACESEGGEGWGSGGPSYDMLDTYLSYVAEVIARCGWKSRSSAKEYGGQATADIAIFHLHPPRHVKPDDLMFRRPEPKSEEVAKAAIAWCQEITDEEVERSEYLHNIRVISRRGIVGPRQSGFAASIVSGYQRHIGELVRKERYAKQAEVSQYVGQPKESLKVQVLVDHVVHIPDYGYGASALHLMVDTQGNRYTWKSASTTLEKGQEVLLKGTVKAHEEYRGKNGNESPMKQTKLWHCKVLELKTYQVFWNAKMAPEIFEVTAEDEKAARKEALNVKGSARLPHGTTIIEKAPEAKPEPSKEV